MTQTKATLIHTASRMRSPKQREQAARKSNKVSMLRDCSRNRMAVGLLKLTKETFIQRTS